MLAYRTLVHLWGLNTSQYSCFPWRSLRWHWASFPSARQKWQRREYLKGTEGTVQLPSAHSATPMYFQRTRTRPHNPILSFLIGTKRTYLCHKFSQPPYLCCSEDLDYSRVLKSTRQNSQLRLKLLFKVVVRNSEAIRLLMYLQSFTGMLARPWLERAGSHFPLQPLLPWHNMFLE